MTMRTIRLGDISKVSSSKRIFAKQYVPSGIPFYRQKEIIDKKNKEEITTPLFISTGTYNEIKNKFGAPEKGDLLITAVGTLGIPYVVDDEVFYFKDGNLIWLRDFDEDINSVYLYYWITSDVGQKSIWSRTIGSAQPALTIDTLKQFEIPVPTIETQNKVVGILSAYDNLIENNQKQIKLLEEAAQRLYKEWFVDLRFPGYEDIKIVDGVPEGWHKNIFSNEVDILSGGTPKTSVTAYYNGNIPFYSPKDADGAFFAFSTQTYITEEGLNNCNSKLYPKDTVIITARGTVGKTVLLAKPMAMNQSCYALKGKNLRSQYYLFFALRIAVDELKTMANGGVFDTIIVKTFDHIFITIPPQEIVDAFDDRIISILNAIKNKTLTISSLKEARDRLLPKLMSGEIEV